MNQIHIVLMVLAIVCFLLSAFPISTFKADRENLIAGGLALWAFATMIT